MDQSRGLLSFWDHDYDEAPSIDDKDDLVARRSPRTRFRWICLLVLTIVGLVILVVSQVAYIFHLQSRATHLKISPYTGLSREYTEDYVSAIENRYWSDNVTEMDKAWAAIEGGHGTVVLDPEWAIAQGLPESSRHPYQTDKAVYFLDGYHALHCLKRLRGEYSTLLHGGSIDDEEHWRHCFDSIRQHIMCNADDTLLFSREHLAAGPGQKRKCRNWDALREWATARSACYHDWMPPPGEERWRKCDGGEDGLPRGGLLG